VTSWHIPSPQGHRQRHHEHDEERSVSRETELSQTSVGNGAKYTGCTSSGWPGGYGIPTTQYMVHKTGR